MFGMFRLKWNSKGEEIPDPVPLATSVQLAPQKSIHDRVLEVLRSERWNEMMRAQGMETFDEANDFEIDDEEPNPESMYEQDEDGHFYGVRAGEVRGRMVQDVEMEEKHRDVLNKVQEHLKNPKKKEEKKDEKSVS